ncbi:hypothetical protein [Nocardia terpenica]|uniref:Ig-like domain repeat protein n=1 Tax=Nocardia terpenica TaxID=455432 RepID=A0A6G9Z7B8_9NOCA|nr:hypothetical protein [Nocardia terpenica]QIS21291.1 hypothetical protein F6W96_26145 [Nocardia terpenica]
MASKLVRITGVALGGAAAVALGAGPAAASTTMTVNGTAVQGCQAQVTATTTSSNPMSLDFYDNLDYLGRVQVTNQGGSMQASIAWTPSAPGDHIISAVAIGSYIDPADALNRLTVHVSNGINLGSACVPLG